MVYALVMPYACLYMTPASIHHRLHRLGRQCIVWVLQDSCLLHSALNGAALTASDPHYGRCIRCMQEPQDCGGCVGTSNQALEALQVTSWQKMLLSSKVRTSVFPGLTVRCILLNPCSASSKHCSPSQSLVWWGCGAITANSMHVVPVWDQLQMLDRPV